MVISQSTIASEVGGAVLREGGNAVDAAVATAFALAVTHPTAGNIGGGGFLVLRLGSGEAVTYDFRETAPANASPTMFLARLKASAPERSGAVAPLRITTTIRERPRITRLPATMRPAAISWSIAFAAANVAKASSYRPRPSSALPSRLRTIAS